MCKAYIRSIQLYDKLQQHRRVQPLEVGELVLLPVGRSEAAYKALRNSGTKVQPRFTMPYRVVRVFNAGRSATCKNLCIVSSKCNEYKEAALQDIRRISPPITEWQRQEWDTILEIYYAGYPLDEASVEKCLKRFWKEVEEVEEAKPESIGSTRKRQRPDVGGVSM